MSSKSMRVCVYCGSSQGRRAAHQQLAREVGTLLAARGVGLVYGGGHRGLMGELADAALAAGGEVIGVIPQSLVDRELAHARLTELHVVSSMHERKERMAQLSSAFIALPGGWGTLDELAEMVTWAQLGLHRKPIGLINSEGYFDALIAFITQMSAEGFVAATRRPLLHVEDNATALLTQLGIPDAA
jgi:uncharacterized protein (TIGR00730 family)